MSAGEISTEVEVGVDGNAVLKLIQQIDKEIDGLAGKLKAAADTAGKGAINFDSTLQNTVRALQIAFSQIATLQKTLQQNQRPITALNQDQALARSTIRATEFAKTLKGATTAADALQARLNQIDKRIANLGSDGQLAKRVDLTKRLNTEQALKDLQKLQTELTGLDTKARRSGGDFSGNRDAVTSAYAALGKATAIPQRGNFTPELQALADAQAAYAKAIAENLTSAEKASEIQKAAAKQQAADAAKENDVERAYREKELQDRQTIGAELAKQHDETMAYRATEAAEAARVAEIERQGVVAYMEAQRQAFEAERQADADRAARLKLIQNQQVQAARETIANEAESMRLAGDRAGLEERLAESAATIAASRERMKVADLAEVEQLNRLIGLEQTRTTQLERQLGILTREQEAQAKASPLAAVRSVLSPARLASSFAQVAVWSVDGAAAYGVLTALHDGAKELVDFQDQLKQLQAITGASDGQFNDLAASILSVATNSKFSVDDLGKVAITLAQAGVTAGNLRTTLQAVNNLAASTGTKPDEAASLVTSTLDEFQRSGSDAGHIADLLSAALNRTKITAQQMGQAIQTAGSTAQAQGVGLEQFLATIGAASQGGVGRESNPGQGLKGFLEALADPTTKLKTMLDQLGVSEGDIDVRTQGLAQVFENLHDKGFNTAEAFDALDHRSAVFYANISEHRDDIDRLQLQFAQYNSAALGAGVATDSLSGSWQKFKNDLVADSQEAFGGVIKDLQSIVEWMDQIMNRVKQFEDRGSAGAKGLSIAGYTALGAGTGAAAGAVFGGVGAVPGTLIGGTAGFFDGVYQNLKRPTSVGGSDLTTKINEQSDAIQNQQEKIAGLNSEMQRIQTQHSSLQNNSVRTAAETASLTSRFEGLAQYLTNTGNRFDDLTQAMRRYSAEQQKTLSTQLLSQVGNLQAQEFSTAQAYVPLLAQARANKSYSPAIQAALRSPFAGSNPQVLTDAARLDPTLLKLSQAIDALVLQNQQANSARDALSNSQALQTPQAEALTTLLGGAQADLDKLRGNPRGSDEDSLFASIRTSTGKAAAQATAILNNPNTPRQFLDTFRGFLSDATGILNSAKEAVAPTKQELSDASKRPKVTLSDISSVMSLLGARLTSGARTQAEQDRLIAEGATSAKNSLHIPSNGVAGDFTLPAGVSKAQVEQILAQHGIHADEVIIESGHGANNGTGPHIHVGVRNGSRVGQDRSDIVAADEDSSLDNSQLTLDQRALTDKLKELAQATTTETFDAAITASKAALDKVNADVKKAATEDLQKRGISSYSPQWAEKMAQVEQTIGQNTEEWEQHVGDAIVKSVALQFKAAQEAFDKAVRPAQHAASAAQARLSGLSLESNRGKIPDYVQTLQQHQAAIAKEDSDSVTLASLGPQIASFQASIATGQAQLDAGGLSSDKVAAVKAELKQYNDQLAGAVKLQGDLRNEFLASAAAPKTFAEGLRDAARAFELTHNFSNTFVQDLNLNIGTALESANSSVTTFFDNILTGSTSAVGAIKGMVDGILKELDELVAQMLAKQALKLLFSAIPGLGGVAGGGGSGLGIMGAASQGLFHGGPVKGYATGGLVTDGIRSQDSVLAMLAKGEFVLNGRAVDSLGPDFVQRLNSQGAAALKGMGQIPVIANKSAHAETKVYVVPPNEQPPLGANDVLLVVNQELLRGGSTAQLVKHISTTA